MTQQISTNTFGVAKWVVSADATQGTHTTVQGAINSATSGDIIFLRSGTYTEDLTLKAGVTIAALRGSGKTANIIVVGNSTFTGAGIATLTGFRLQTNGASLLTVSGSAASIVNLTDMDLRVSNATGITFSSSSASAQINLVACSGDITGSFAFLVHTSAGTFDKRYTEITNSAGSTVASTASAGFFNCRWSKKSTPITTSSTCVAVISWSVFDCSAINTTACTFGGTTTTSNYNRFLGGTASAVSVGGTMNSDQDVVTSSNTNAITGGGTLNYIGTAFAGSSSTVNVTTKTGVGLPSANGTSGQVLTANGPGAIPTFQAAGSGGISNVTGQIFTASGAFTYTPTAGTKYAIVELVGGGGQGGGSNGTPVTNGGGGGGGAGYVRFILTAAQIGASLTGSIGTGGSTGGASANGQAGSNTTLATASGWTAGGGGGGNSNDTNGVGAGGIGGTNTTGTGTLLANIVGMGGISGLRVLTSALGGNGGNSVLGNGAPVAYITASAANGNNAPQGYGGGGSGSVVSTGGSAAAGGHGANGVAIFTEFQ